MTAMSGHEKKPRVPRVSPSTKSTSSIIAQPPRAALHGRTKADHIETPSNDTASTKSIPDTNPPSPSPESSSPPSRDEEKDRRIHELEKEIAEMEDVFQRELTQYSHKLVNERETAEFWQSKHSALNQNYLKTDTELRILRSDFSNLAVSREDRDRDIKTRISSLALSRDEFREAYNEAMGEIRMKEGEIKSLREQVWGLKSFVSSNGKGVEQVTDEVVAEGMQRLGNGLQNWVISNFRRMKIDTTLASPETQNQLTNLLPAYATLAQISKIHMIQSLVSHLLVTQIFSAYFIGLSHSQAAEFLSIEKTLSSYGTAEALNTWRSTTLSILSKSSSHDSKIMSETETVISSIVSQLNNILSNITVQEQSTSTESRDTSLRSLLTSAISLSRLLRVQKAVFEIKIPVLEEHQQTIFDNERMEDIGGEDEDSLQGREIVCAVFPGVEKRGDENGERGHLVNIVSKIKVLCAPD